MLWIQGVNKVYILAIQVKTLLLVQMRLLNVTVGLLSGTVGLFGYEANNVGLVIWKFDTAHEKGEHEHEYIKVYDGGHPRL